MELDSDHVNGGCAAVARVVEEIAAYGYSCAVGVLLLWAIVVDTNTRIHDVAFAIWWSVFVADENNGVGAFADSGNALSKTLKFFCVGFAP
jgi:hypothetical protein